MIYHPDRGLNSGSSVTEELLLIRPCFLREGRVFTDRINSAHVKLSVSAIAGQ